MALLPQNLAKKKPQTLVLMRGPILFVLSLLLAAGARGQDLRDTGENQFGVSRTLFSALAAINAAGYDAGMDSALNDHFKLRTQIREILAKRQIPCLTDLKEFYKAHRKPTEAADLGQYLSFALVAGEAPKFELPGYELPPDVEPLRGFSELLARFYKEANLDDLWTRSQTAYASAMSEYQDSVITTLFEANGYLRNPSGYLGRRFRIYLDLLGAPNQAQVRNYKDDYFIVITPTNAPVVDEVRDAYLAYLLDPLSFKYAAAIKEKKALQKYAEDAPALELAYKDDFSLLVTKCLIKAIDSRVMHGGAEQREAYVNRAMSEGFILTAAFSVSLLEYERQPDAFRLYYPNMIAAIDLKRERKRLSEVHYVQSVAPRIIASPAKMQLDPAEESLQAAEGLYEASDYEAAQRTFRKVFQQTADKALHGRAYYGLGRIAAHMNQNSEANEMFQRTVDSGTNAPIVAWSHVYLGRLALAAHNTKKADAEFRSALAMDGISSMAREAAEKGIQSTSPIGDKQP
ncbi:MAG TPA: tetratricopeptide repeat protein [Bryobacteraceae bacterium]|nr:tetratricopeptide repeat protein [Bryobacteraceae bacterium]